MMETTEKNIALDKLSVIEELGRLTAEMGIPEFQQTKAKWLVKNLPKRYSSHANFPTALQYAKLILTRGWS